MVTELDEDWRSWIEARFSEYTAHDFAPEHEEFWEHVWTIEAGERPPPFVAIWPRGWAKSTSAEMAVVALGLRKKKRYALYVCGTQDQADDHVQNIGDMLEAAGVERMVTRYGTSAGWRRNRLRTAGGFTVDAIGLDTASRGRKLEEARPDLIVLDDLDEESDSKNIVEKKIRALTRKILPAGAEDLAVLAVQNLVHSKSIFSKLVDGVADFLRNRIVCGPIPAVENLVIEERSGHPTIVGGRATWAGMPITRCQEILDDEGLRAFLSERQHRTRDPRAAVFEREWWASGRNRYDIHDPTREIVARYISLDLAMKDKETSSYNALVVLELTNPGYYLDVRYVWREKLSFPRLMPKLEPMALRWNFDQKLRGFIIEDKAHGVTAVQTIEEGTDEWLKGILVAFNPGAAPKQQRWEQAASWGEVNCLRLPHPGTSRNEVGDLFDFEEELYDLPASEYKDWADAYSQGVIFLEHLVADGYRARAAYAGAA